MKFSCEFEVSVCVCMIVEQLFGISPNECHNRKQKQNKNARLNCFFVRTTVFVYDLKNFYQILTLN